MCGQAWIENSNSQCFSNVDGQNSFIWRFFPNTNTFKWSITKLCATHHDSSFVWLEIHPNTTAQTQTQIKHFSSTRHLLSIWSDSLCFSAGTDPEASRTIPFAGSQSCQTINQNHMIKIMNKCLFQGFSWLKVLNKFLMSYCLICTPAEAEAINQVAQTEGHKISINKSLSANFWNTESFEDLKYGNCWGKFRDPKNIFYLIPASPPKELLSFLFIS